MGDLACTTLRLIFKGPFLGFGLAGGVFDLFFFGFFDDLAGGLDLVAFCFLAGVKSPGMTCGPPRARASRVLAAAASSTSFCAACGSFAANAAPSEVSFTL